jgi:acyl carrier protein
MLKGTDKVADDAKIIEELAAILAEVADVNPEDVSADKSFVDDLDVDSLSMVEVAMAVEEKFNTKIPDDKLADLKTVGDAVDYIKKHAGA